MSYSCMQRLLSLCVLLVWVAYIIADAYAFGGIQSPTHAAADTTPPIQVQTQATALQPQTPITSGSSLQIHNTFLVEDALVLSHMYEQTKDPAIGKHLVLKLMDLYQFDRALDYAQTLNTAVADTIDPTTYLYILINSSRVSPGQAHSIDIVQQAVNNYVAAGKLTADDQYFYGALIKLRNNDFYGAKILFDKITGDTYSAIITNMRDVYTKATTMQDMPLYYGTALFSLQLLKNGYFSVASKLALEVLAKDPNYTLPYQILAYKHFLTQSWEPALQYLLQLRDLDPEHESTYIFMIGVSSYRLQKYEQAVLYLKQVQDPDHTLDAQRYLVLSYLAMNNTQDAINTRQTMLGNALITKEDFYNYFTEVFYKPYVQKGLYVLYNTNTNLSYLFLTSCFDTLQDTDQDVCDYGKAGLAIAKHDTIQAKNILSPLSEKYQDPYIYQALGYIALSQGDQLEGTDYLTRAISIVRDAHDASAIKQQLLDTN